MIGNADLFASESDIGEVCSLSARNSIGINSSGGVTSDFFIILSRDCSISASLSTFVYSIGFRPVVLSPLGASTGIVAKEVSKWFETSFDLDVFDHPELHNVAGVRDFTGCKPFPEQTKSSFANEVKINFSPKSNFVEILICLRKAIVDGSIQCFGMIIDVDSVEDVVDLHHEIILFRSDFPYIPLIISSKWVSSHTNHPYFYLWDSLIGPPYNDAMLSGAFALALSRVLP
jgi:hypothetical protein